MAWATQEPFAVRFDWGPAGVERLAPHVRALVIVDVLRFTSAVETACATGVEVYPYRWRDDSAAGFAQSVGAVLAGRHDEGRPSLSPESLRRLPVGSKVVLPSPNGSACSVLANEAGATVIAGCLRNASAVARHLSALEGAVGVIACGEVWRDGSIRPAVEDLLGAGAILNRLVGRLSPEAAAAAAAFSRAADEIEETLLDAASGRELIGYGLEADVRWCAALDASEVVPVLSAGAYKPAG